MSKFQFNGTGGTWFVSGGDQIVSMPSQTKISNNISGDSYEEAQANAKLISYAPKMLNTLIDHRKRISELRDIMEDQHSMWSHHRQMFNDLINESEELINKALGTNRSSSK